MKDWVAYKHQKFISQFWKLEAQEQVASMVNEGFFFQVPKFSFYPHMVEGMRDLFRASVIGALIPYT